MIKFVFQDLASFYRESDHCETASNGHSLMELENGLKNDRYGETREEILSSKFSYKKGLDKLEELKLDWDIGGNGRKYKWSETDGDDMSMERFHENLSFMSQRVRTVGDSNGKFIDMYINMDISAGFSNKQMLYRSFMTIQICDWLEQNGYRVSITLYDSYTTKAHYRGHTASDNKVLIEILLKSYDEPVNKGLIVAASAPWMLRYHIFKFMFNKFDSVSLCCGFIAKEDKTKRNLLDIGRHGYDKNSADKYIAYVKKNLEVVNQD